MCLGNFPTFSETFRWFAGGDVIFGWGVEHCKMLDEVGKFHGGSMAFKKRCG